MKVLVLGATGLLGQHLTEFLKNKEYQVVTHGYSQKADYNVDLRDITSCTKLLEKVEPSVIINTIALTDVDRCEEFPNEAYELNTKIVENISSYLKKTKNILLIHFSTDMVYDGKGENLEEEIKPQNVYSLTKYCAEKDVISIDGIVLRTNFFGDSDGVDNKLSFSDWIITSVKNRKNIKFINDVYFSPLHLDTLAKMVSKAIENPISGVYNLGSREGFSKSKFARSICSMLGLDSEYIEDISVEDLGLQAFRPKQMRMDVNKFESTFDVTLPKLEFEIQKLSNKNEL